MARQRQRQFLGRHAAAVIRHPDQRPPAIGDRDLDPAGAGVQRVLDQLLDRRCRTLDHLARGDAVDRRLVKLTNDRAGSCRVYLGVRGSHATRLSMSLADSASGYWLSVSPAGWPTTTKCSPSGSSSWAATRLISASVTAEI